MRIQALILVLVIGVAGLLPAQGGPLPITYLNGDVWDGNGGPLVAGRVYAVLPMPNQPTAISVPAGRTLTMQGAIVKFDGTGLNIDGTVLANASTLTAWRDDSVGGDSNGDGGGAGARGDWGGITVFGAGYLGAVDCELRFGGQDLHQGPSRPLIWGRGSSQSIRFLRTRLLGALGNAFQLENGDVRIDQCEVGFCEAVGTAPIGSADQLVTNLAHDNVVCDEWHLTQIYPAPSHQWAGTTLQLGPVHTMNGGGTFIVDDLVTIPRGKILELIGPLVVKFQPARSLFVAESQLRTSGRLVSFTSSLDDSRGGRLDKRSPGLPAAGDWDGIAGSGSVNHPAAIALSNAEIVYAGGPWTAPNPSLSVGAHCDLELFLTAISWGFGHGVVLSAAGTEQHSIRECRIEDCAGVALRGIPLHSVPHCRLNVAVRNGLGDYFETTSAVDLLGDAVIGYENYPGDALVIGAGQQRIRGNGHLTLLGRTTLKVTPGTGNAWLSVDGGGRLDLEGSGDRQIVVTSLRDDAVGGDTNKDGRATRAAPGDYGSIYLAPTAGPSSVRYLRSLFAHEAVSCDSPRAVISQVRVEFAFGVGLRVNAIHGNVLGGVAVVDSAGSGIAVDGLFDLEHVTVVGAAHYGIEKGPNRRHHIHDSIVWNCGWSNQNGFQASEVFHCNGLFAGQNGNVSVDPQLDPVSLAPLPGSPMIGAGDPGRAALRLRDVDGNCRRLENGTYGVGGVDGGPDLGAVERAPFLMTSDGESVLGGVLRLDVSGPGTFTWILLLGLQDGTFELRPYGTVLVGTSALFDLTIQPGGSPAFLAIPNAPVLTGLRFGLQALALPDGAAGLGSLTNDRECLIR